MTPKGETPPIARTPEEWVESVRKMGGRGFHARQIFRWIHARGVIDAEKMSDLPSAMRTALVADGLAPVVAISEERRAADQTRKILARLHDGATIETVLIPNVSGGKSRLPNPVEQDADASAAVDDDDEVSSDPDAPGGDPVTRVTQCISTQVGCAMGCVFCASGQAGLKRHLGADEIVGQVLLGRSRLDPGEQLRNVVYMGMGEPLHNYEATARSLKLLTHQDGIALSSRRVTVSTSGLVPEIERLGKDFGGNIGLAISLHAADDETRSRLLPINKKYPLAKLMGALHAYPLPSRRRITIEYTLVAGRNDNIDEARKVSRLLRGLPVKVNLIPMNPISDSTLGPPDMSSVLAFQQVLCDDGYSCFIRRRRGDDVSAACGQLALAGAKRKIRLVS